MLMVHAVSLSAIDLNLLVVLSALLRERHVTRAAQIVGLSQSATSHALSRLRELCDDPLLVRHGRRLELTPRATQLLPGLERGLAELHGVVTREPAFDPRRAQRSFALGMPDYVQALLLRPLLQSLPLAAPGVDFNVLGFPNLSELIESGALDLAISVTAAIAANLSQQTLFDDGFVCMVRKGHPDVGAKLTLDRYLSLQHVVVAPTGTSGSFVDTELERRGLARRVALRVSSFMVAPIVVAETDFISTMPERLARRMAKRFGLHLLPPPLRIPRFGLAMAWHPRFDEDPAHRWLRGFVSRAGSRR